MAAMRNRLVSILSTGNLALLLLVAPAGVRVAQGKTVGPQAVAWKDTT
jgi:hypothetical protein